MSNHEDRKQKDAKLEKSSGQSSEIVDQSLASVSKDIAAGAAKGAMKGAVKGAIAGAIEGASDEARKASATAQNNAEVEKRENPKDD